MLETSRRPVQTERMRFDMHDDILNQMTPPILARYWSKVDKRPNDNVGGPRDKVCWTWTGHRHESGYGIFGFGGKRVRVSHIALALDHEPKPEGAWAIHACDNPACCNPDHLRWGNPADNTLDMLIRGKNAGKLSDRDVKVIFASKEKPSVLARRFGVGTETIRKVQRQETFRHITILRDVIMAGYRKTT